jgi:CRP-like cAMP-binding protein
MVTSPRSACAELASFGNVETRRQRPARSPTEFTTPDYDRGVPLNTNEKVALLKRIPLFAACTKTELVKVAARAEEREALAGDTLTEEGQPGREFFVLVAGAAVVRRRGRKLANLAAGDWFGELAILRSEPRTATVTATSRVLLLVISDRAFHRVIEATPQIALKVLESVAQRLGRDAHS